MPPEAQQTQTDPTGGQEMPPEENSEFTLKDSYKELTGLSLDEAGGDLPPSGDQQGQPAQDLKPFDPPPMLPTEHHADWKNLTPGLQKYYMDRGREMDAAHTQRSQEVASIRSVMERYAPNLQPLGLDPVNAADMAMNYMVPLLRGTNEQKIQTLFQIARDVGADFGQAANNPNNDPLGIHAQIQAGMQPLQRQVQQQQQFMSWQQQQNAMAQQQQANTALEAFKADKDPAGNLKHPYWEEVQDQMLALAQARRLQTQQPLNPGDIAGLYEQACWLSPSVRVKLQASTAAARNSQGKTATEQERQQRSRAAAGGLSGKGGEGDSGEQPATIRDALRANLHRMRA